MSRVQPSMALLALALVACAPSTDVKIPERKVPTAFPSQQSGKSLAAMNWRTYFRDERLIELIGSALADNPDVFIALQRIEVARAGVKHSKGVMLPQVSAGAGVGVTKASRYTAEGAGNRTTEITPGRTVPTNTGDFSVGLESTWEIDAWGKLRSMRDSAVAQYLATLEGTHLVITGLVADVATAYFELVALDHIKEILEQTLVRQKEAVQVVQLQKLAGRSNELAVQQFEAQLASTKALDADVAMRIKEMENRVNFLRGRYPGPVPRTREVLLRDVPSSVATGVPSELLKNRPDIREAELRVRATKFDLEAARAAFFPTITIAAGVGLQALNPKYLLSVPESLAYSASLGLAAPIINRSAIEAQFDAAKAYQIQALYEFQKAILNGYVEVANGLSTLASSAQIVGFKKEQKAAVAQTVETADMLYRAGKASYFEVLMAQQNTLSADLELIDALRQQHLASIFIYKALGGGWRSEKKAN